MLKEFFKNDLHAGFREFHRQIGLRISFVFVGCRGSETDGGKGAGTQSFPMTRKNPCSLGQSAYFILYKKILKE